MVRENRWILLSAVVIAGLIGGCVSSSLSDEIPPADATDKMSAPRVSGYTVVAGTNGWIIVNSDGRVYHSNGANLKSLGYAR